MTHKTCQQGHRSLFRSCPICKAQEAPSKPPKPYVHPREKRKKRRDVDRAKRLENYPYKQGPRW